MNIASGIVKKIVREKINKKAFNEEIITLIAIIILFAIVGAVAIYILKKYGVI